MDRQNLPSEFNIALELDERENYLEALEHYYNVSNLVPQLAKQAIHCLEAKALTDEYKNIRTAFLTNGTTFFDNIISVQERKEKLNRYTNIYTSQIRFQNKIDFINTINFYRNFDLYRDYKKSFIDYLTQCKDYLNCISVFEEEFDYIDNNLKDYDFELEVLIYIKKNSFMNTPERKKTEELLEKYFDHGIIKRWIRKEK